MNFELRDDRGLGKIGGKRVSVWGKCVEILSFHAFLEFPYLFFRGGETATNFIFHLIWPELVRNNAVNIIIHLK